MKSETYQGGKSKEHHTELLCSNVDGLEKLKPMVNRKCAISRKYTHNKNAWMMTKISVSSTPGQLLQTERC
jgi:hypothetical protein